MSDDLNEPRKGILSLLDGFIEQVQSTRKVLLGVSASAMILAPLAIALSVYLMLHPAFYAVLEECSVHTIRLERPWLRRTTRSRGRAT